MAKTVVGLFDTADEAKKVVSDLLDFGFTRDEISLVANNAKGETIEKDNPDADADTDPDTGTGTHRDIDGDGNDNKAAEGAGTGAVGGTVVGGLVGLLVGLGALAIPGIGPVIAAGSLATVLGSTALGAGIGAAAGGLAGGLIGMGVPEEDAHYYSEGVRQGGTLITVSATDNDMAQNAYDIMQKNGAVDIDDRSTLWQQKGGTPFDTQAASLTSEELSTTSQTATTQSRSEPAKVPPVEVSTALPIEGNSGVFSPDSSLISEEEAVTSKPTTVDAIREVATGAAPAVSMEATRIEDLDGSNSEMVLPIFEEQLQVTKRQIQKGGVRVYTYVQEKPVEAEVQLREEKVSVLRRPVDRLLTEADATSFKDATFEVTTRGEEAIVSKQAWVVEEVTINKEVQARVATVSDTVRRTNIEVENLDYSVQTPLTSGSHLQEQDKDKEDKEM